MTHLIATRLRIAGMENATLRRSLALLAQIRLAIRPPAERPADLPQMGRSAG